MTPTDCKHQYWRELPAAQFAIFLKKSGFDERQKGLDLRRDEYSGHLYSWHRCTLRVAANIFCSVANQSFCKARVQLKSTGRSNMANHMRDKEKLGPTDGDIEQRSLELFAKLKTVKKEVEIARQNLERAMNGPEDALRLNLLHNNLDKLHKTKMDLFSRINQLKTEPRSWI